MRPNSNFHRCVSRAYEFAPARNKMRIHRHACAISTHRHANRLRVNESAHSDAHKFESACAARYATQPGLPIKVAPGFFLFFLSSQSAT